ncbi:hypothetical protein GGS23DRAFT_501505 [Durotheca rogersii]|uniref:uncharacterized protein n=1 Tax=Durotheca rogersii TaxID=419775 RepID=UPI00221FA6FD|nr:uncharacterized protein GGS23DRAFT_501505 [Durotheca rogersii]KAI5864456.1 hypothetical protein GGS23DRAFT_501505 [Durotheca rogersii]
MANECLPQTVGFLTDAAHLLSKTAPETSAYMMTRRNALLLAHGLELSDAQRQHACGACGHIMIPGRGSKLEIIGASKARERRGRGRGKGKKGGRQEKEGSMQKGSTAGAEQSAPTVGCRKRVTCGMCGCYTDILVPRPPRIARHRATAPSKSASTATSTVAATLPKAAIRPPVESAKLSANASSKKRAKSRKEGLQALLQQAQSSAPRPQNGFGLSLRDFMLK